MLVTLLALTGSTLAFDAQTADAWDHEGTEVQYLDESYEDGIDVENVVGGEQVSNDRWEATVGVVMNGYVGCTGTLIHPKVALTAAHCAGGISGILVGNTDYLEDDGEIVPVIETIVHPDYYTSMFGGNDIAILRLGERVTSVEPQKLAIECLVDDYVKNGARVHVVGYGATQENGGGWNTKMNEGGTFVQTKDCTATEVDGFWTGCDPDIAPGGEIGAGGEGVDACFGDSGGPLYLKTAEGDFLIGVTSRAYAGVPGSAPCKYGGIYTRPDYYVKWIEQESGAKLDYHLCNDAPDATAPGILTKPGKTGYTALAVHDPDGDSMVMGFEIVEQGEFGTATVDQTGTIAYTANDGVDEGYDFITVAITDGGNPDYKRSGGPATTELEIPVEIKKGLFVTPSGAEAAGCGCETTSGGAGWLAIGALGLLGLRRRRE